MPEEKRYYMACLDLEGRSALVVGGGAVAREKVEGLLDCGATTVTRAPHSRRPSTFSTATLPPPTTRQLRPSRWRQAM